MNSVGTQNTGYSNDICYEPLDEDNDLNLHHQSGTSDINGYDDENAIDPSCVQADMLGNI